MSFIRDETSGSWPENLPKSALAAACEPVDE
jgi:hypothetical protein